MALIDVIKYNGGPDIFAWKYPSEELATWTQLIVNESQEVILIEEGKAVAIFGPGRYTLDTKNIPLLRDIVRIPFGGKTPFTAEVWYINKVQNLDIRWGTPSPVQIQDPKYGIFVPVRANGILGIQISDSWRFLTKLVATSSVFGKVEISNYFRGLCITHVKDAISSYLFHKQISILEINAYLNEVSQHIEERIKPVMCEYGIGLVSFFVNEISVPENDVSVRQLKDALAKRAEMSIIGYDYQQDRSFDVLEGLAKNPGSPAAALVGAGVGLGLGGTIGSAFGNMTGQMQQQNANCSKLCPVCHKLVPKMSKFCPECGKSLTLQCIKCGNIVQGTSKFCSACGERL